MVAPTLLGFFDIEVEASGSAPDGRWRVEGLILKKPDVPQVRLEYVELPGFWEYGKAFLDGRKWGQRHSLDIGATRVRLQSSAERVEVEEREGPRWQTLFSDVNGILAVADRWLPPVSVASLDLEQVEGAAIFSGRDLHFDNRAFVMELEDALVGHSVSLELGLDPEAWELRAQIAAEGLDLNARMQPSETGVLFEAELSREQEGIEIGAVLVDGQSLPAEASVRTAGFTLPDELLPVSVARQLSGVRMEQADLRWGGGRYRGTLRLDGLAVVEGALSPVRAEIELEGDVEQLRLVRLELESSWFQAALDAPLVVALGDGSISGPGQFRVTSDLARQSFFDARGTIRGMAEVHRSGAVDFDLAGESIRFGGYGLAQVRVNGRADRSEIGFRSIALKLPEEAAGQVDLRGRYQWSDKYLEIQYEGTLEQAFFQKYAGLSWLQDTVVLSGEIRGDPLAPEVRGQLKCGVVDLPAMQPAALSAKYSFQAPGSGAVDLVWQSGSEQIELEVEGSLEEEGMMQGELQAFSVRSADEAVFELLAPVGWHVPFGGTEAENFAQAEFGQLEVGGSGGRGSMVKAAGGPLELAVSGFSPDRVNPWLEAPLPAVVVRELGLKLSALSPVVRGELDLILEEERPMGLVRVELAQLGFGSDLSIGGAELTLDEAVVLRTSGSLPLVIDGPGSEAGPGVRLVADGELDFHAETLSAGPLSEMISRWTGLDSEAPELKFDLGGTVQAPEGQLRVQADWIRFERFRYGPDLAEPLPAVRSFDLRCTADGKRLQVEGLEAIVRGGRVIASGVWALPEGVLAGQAEKKNWRDNLLPRELELSFTDWEVENWTPYMPAMLRRSGRLSGSVRYEPEAGLSGLVTFDGLALRPSRNFPAVDSIRGKFRVEDQLLTLADAGAQVGGSPVSMRGELDLGAWPETRWEVALSGKNIPIVRRPELILRSDLEVSLKSGAESGAAQLAGDLDLRSSTMLVEFDPLSPPTQSGPSSRPPFFAVEEAPFNQWALDLRIEGERFLRIRSPYFRSMLSAGFDLSGTLGQPELIGGVRVEEGNLSFPGAKLRIDSGEAYIEAAAPNTLRLDVTGTARTGTHVISMQVGGSTAEPQIRFEASPPLPNSAIVRLLSTGSATGGGGGSVGLYLGRGLLGAGGMGENLGDRLSVEVGEETTRSGRSAVGVQYKFNESLSLKSEYDIYDSYNTDLLWTIFKR
ncbi:MAG: translocation/assembly module TamB domain-containing protein [Opitutales bacterium]